MNKMLDYLHTLKHNAHYEFDDKAERVRVVAALVEETVSDPLRA